MYPDHSDLRPTRAEAALDDEVFTLFQHGYEKAIAHGDTHEEAESAGERHVRAHIGWKLGADE